MLQTQFFCRLTCADLQLSPAPSSDTWAGLAQQGSCSTPVRWQNRAEHSFLLSSSEAGDSHRGSSCGVQSQKHTDHGGPEQQSKDGAEEQDTGLDSRHCWQQAQAPDSFPGHANCKLLRMTHVGLGAKQLDKVQAAIEAADGALEGLDMSSKNLFADQSFHEPAQPGKACKPPNRSAWHCGLLLSGESP